MSKEENDEVRSEDSSRLSQSAFARNRGQIVLVAVFLAVAGLIIALVLARGIRTTGAANSEHTESKDAGEKHGDEHAEEGKHAEEGAITLDEEAEKEIGIEFETVQMRSTSGILQITGVVGPNETRQAHIRPLSLGRVEKVYIRPGDRVRAGQPLVAYDNIELGELISEYVSANATLEKANAEADVSNRSVERAQKLIELGAVTKAELEKRQAEYKSAIASINVQKAQAEMIEQKMRRFGLTDADIQKLDGSTKRHNSELLHTVLRSPFDGVIIKSEVVEGEAVDLEREMFTIANLSTVWVQGNVYEKDIASIRQGQEVRISVNAYPNETFVGRLTYVSDVLDPQTRTAKVRCEVANPRGILKLEMFATIQLPTGVPREALMIPAAAVQQIENESSVFVKVDEHKFEKRKVELGAQNDGWAEVREGLKQGDTVVTKGAFMLKSHLKKEEFGEDHH